MSMIVFQRDKDGNLDKDSTLFVESQAKVDNIVKELVEGTETAKNLKENTQAIKNLSDADVNTMLAIAEIYETILNLKV